jgi:hypothetical protein
MGNSIRAAFLMVLCAPFLAHGFEINPSKDFENGTYSDGKLFSPVHELMTIEALKRVDKELLSDIDIAPMIRDMVRGVRWNDDPYQMARTKGLAFVVSVKDSCRDSKSAKVGSDYGLPYRTHCADMQFLHAMASRQDEPASSTLAKLLMWLEFTYKVSIGDIEKNHYLRSIDQKLTTESGTLFRAIMTDNGNTRSLWQPQDLFTLDCSLRGHNFKCKKFEHNHSNESIRNIALGSMLHVLQDSFSDSHLEREPSYVELVSKIHGRGAIKLFYSYAKQDSALHNKADKLPKELGQEIAEDSSLSMENVCAEIITNVLKDRRDQTNSWSEVENYFRKTVFVLEDSAALPSGGKYMKQPIQ